MIHVPRIAPLRRQVREATMPDENRPARDSQVQPLPAEATEAVTGDEQRRIWKSDDLLGGDTEALILHHGQTYRLRRTKQGKLILYK
jgi:hemin uptake protein HemP